MRGVLSTKQLNRIKHEILFMFEECEVVSYPIDCFAIAKKLYYVLRPYSSLSPDEYQKALSIDPDGYSTVEKNPDTGMNEYVIYYNDSVNEGRMRWTIFHEIGHIYLGHHDHPDNSQTVIEEAEADFFAKYTIAPPPLINIAKCECPMDIAVRFKVSGQASIYLFVYYRKWMEFGPREYEPFELEMLQLFQAA
ncbi:MAG: ImmA/IrrE family metallo-endopeptidase [Lachnospira sp.]|nr:ImmA/IrrE family metallo-endopeptidase [Lachnospira sp.]